MSGGKNKRPILNEMPVEELKTLRETHPQVNLRITRQNNNNQWQSIRPQYFCEVEHIMSGDLEQYLQEFSGGGGYVIEVRDPNDTGNHLCNRFRLTLPGQMRDPKLNPQAPAAFGQNAYASPYASPGGPGGVPQGPYAPPGVAQQQSGPIPGVQVPPGAHQAGLPMPQWLGPGQVSLPPQDQVPGWVKAQTPGEQWTAFYDAQRKQGRLPDGASMHSDQLAVNQANTWQSQYSSERAENAKLREMLDTIQRQQSEMEKKYERQMAELKETYEKQLHQTEMQSLRDEIRQSQQSKGTDWGQMMQGMAPLLGIYAEIKKQQEQHAHERSIAQQSGNKNDFAELLEKITPLAIPAVKAYFENNSPATKAEANLENDKAKIMMMQMMSEMIRSQAESSGGMSEWMPLIEGVMGAIQDWGGAKMLPSGGAPQGLPAGTGGTTQPQGQPQTQATAGQQPAHGGTDLPSAFDEMDAQAAKMTRMVLQHIPVESGFHTHEWKTVLFNIHAQLDPDELAPGIIDLLEHCTRFMLVPGALRDWATQPETTFKELLDKLPIAKQSPEYATRLVDTLIAEVRYRALEEQERMQQEQREAATDGAPKRPDPTVTPAPETPADTGSGFSRIETLEDDGDGDGNDEPPLEADDDRNDDEAWDSESETAQSPPSDAGQPEVY